MQVYEKKKNKKNKNDLLLRENGLKQPQNVLRTLKKQLYKNE